MLFFAIFEKLYIYLNFFSSILFLACVCMSNTLLRWKKWQQFIKRTLFFGNCCCKWRKMRCFFSRSLMLVGTLTTNEEKKITLCEYYCYFTFHSFECVRFGVTFTHYTNTIHWCDAYQKPYGFNIGHSIATDGAVYPKTHRFIVNNQPSHNILSIKIYFYSTNVWVFCWTLIDLIKLKANKNNVRFLYLILLK